MTRRRGACRGDRHADAGRWAWQTAIRGAQCRRSGDMSPTPRQEHWHEQEKGEHSGGNVHTHGGVGERRDGRRPCSRAFQGGEIIVGTEGAWTDSDERSVLTRRPQRNVRRRRTSARLMCSHSAARARPTPLPHTPGGEMRSADYPRVQPRARSALAKTLRNILEATFSACRRANRKH